jgi:4-amino-4-deoxy-L-arabinose transferase-like glycosyltransferase
VNTTKNIDRIIIAAGFFIFFAIGFYCACHLGMNHAPDEYMRYDLCEYIYTHNKLPIGNEPELIDNIWGFSYAFTPYLIQCLSVVFMKLASLFSTEPATLLIAARIPSVLAYALGFVFAYRIGCELLSDRLKSILLACMIFGIPQVYFLAGYINNDIVILTECCALVLIWIRGYKYTWTTSRCILLGITVGITMLTYYNAYVYILLSAVAFLWCMFAKEKVSFQEFVKKAGIAVGVALLIAAWYFIRNLIIYDGDLLGLNAQRMCAEIHAGAQRPQVINGPSSGLTPFAYFWGSGLFAENNWFKTTIKSLLGIFGYMNYPIAGWMYKFYIAVMVAGIACFLYFFFFKYKEAKKHKCMMAVVIIASLALTWMLSLYYSWTSNYQAQGRYVITSLIPTFLCASVGYRYVVDRFSTTAIKRKIAIALEIAFGLIYIAVSTHAILYYLIPSCFLDLPI